MSRIAAIPVLTLLACAPQADSSTSEVEQNPGGAQGDVVSYGPDCAATLLAATVCDCDEVSVSWEGISSAASVEMVAIDMSAEDAAAAVCADTLTQADLVGYLEVNVDDEDEGTTSANFDLGGRSGQVAYFVVYDRTRSVLAYMFAEVADSSDVDSLSLGAH